MSNTLESPAGATFKVIALHLIHESKWNTRKTFAKEEDTKLEASLRTHGQLMPGIGREVKGGGVELAAGARRRRALEAIGARTMDVIVRPMSDVEFLETIIIDNNQRADIHPLEEAEGFAELLKQSLAAGKGQAYDVTKLAARVGRSDQYVYDRLQLLKLVPDAKKLFLANRIQLGHAVILSRLSTDDQKKALDPDGAHSHGAGRSGLWTSAREGELFAGEGFEDGDRYADVKPVTPREFQLWVNDNARFDPKNDPTAPQLFPKAVAAVKSAEETKTKVVHITYEYRVPDGARSEQRTYGENGWLRADGEPDVGREDEKASKKCEYARLGLVVAGPSRGDAFLVCVSKDRCKTHWPAEVKAREARDKRAAQKAAKKVTVAKKAAAGDEKAKEKLERDAAAEALAAKREEREQAVEQIVVEEFKSSILAAIDKAKDAEASPKGALGGYIVDEIEDNSWFELGRDELKALKSAKSAAGMIRVMVKAHVENRLDDFVDMDEQESLAKSFGVNVKAIRSAAEAKVPPLEDPTPAKAGKTATKKKGKKAK